MDRPGSAAERGDHCRPALGDGKPDPLAGPRLTHDQGCPGGRVEVYDVVVRRPRLGATATGVKRVSRCCDCTAHAAEWHVPPPRIEPGTAGWWWAWRWHPHLIAEQLTPAEQQDPTLNPLHPEARHELLPVTDLDLLAAEMRARGPRYPHMHTRR